MRREKESPERAGVAVARRHHPNRGYGRREWFEKGKRLLPGEKLPLFLDIQPPLSLSWCSFWILLPIKAFVTTWNREVAQCWRPSPIRRAENGFYEINRLSRMSRRAPISGEKRGGARHYRFIANIAMRQLYLFPRQMDRCKILPPGFHRIRGNCNINTKRVTVAMGEQVVALFFF